MHTCKKILVGCFIAGLTSSLYAQPHRGSYDFDFIRESNPWLQAANASALGTLQPEKTSFVSAYFRKDNGGLMQVGGSDDSFSAGALTESYVRISDKIAFYGKLGYSYFQGRNMGAFLYSEPSYFPVNFIEYSSDNIGNKNSESYLVSGGIAYAFDDKWSIGGKADYVAGNYAKRKDPRHLNEKMDLTLSAGGRFAPGPRFSIGLNALYLKKVETLTTKVFGTTDKQYYTFIDYGCFFGKREGVQDTDVSIVSTSAKPASDSYYGGALQIEVGEKTKFFSEITYLMRNGYYGKRASGSVVYFENNASVLSYDGTVLINKSDNLHRIGVSVTYEGLANNENIYRKTTNVGESTVVEYLGQNEVLRRTDLKAGLSYTGYLGIKNHRPEWEYGIDAGFDYRSSLVTIYPYYRSQLVSAADVSLFGKKNFSFGKNIITFRLDLGCHFGFGTPKIDGTLASASSDAPLSMDDLLYKDFEYKTAPRISGAMDLRYTRLLRKNFSIFAEASDSFGHLLAAPQYLTQSSVNIFLITVGCVF